MRPERTRPPEGRLQGVGAAEGEMADMEGEQKTAVAGGRSHKT
jgi:hypothetical protein